jgi:hypothetical protein
MGSPPSLTWAEVALAPFSGRRRTVARGSGAPAFNLLV